MDLLKETLRIACLAFAVANGVLAVYHARKRNFDRAAYWMAFAAFMVAVSK